MIVSCGEALIDFIPAVRGAEAGYVPRPGGSPCNVAVGVARLGVPAGFLGALSTDLFGDMLAGHLDANHVSRRFVRRLDRPSTLGFVSLPGGGEPRYAFYGEGAADRNLTPDLVPDDLGDEVEALHVGSFSLAVQPVAGTLHRLLERESARRVVSLDPNGRPGLVGGHAEYLWTLESVITHADLVKVSRADLDWLYPGAPLGEVAVHWMSLGPRLVVVTLGGDGAVALRNDGTVQM